MRSLGVVDLDMDGDLRFLSWEQELVAVVDDYERRAVVSIDPRSKTSRHVIRSTARSCRSNPDSQGSRAPARAAQGIGPLRLAVAGGEGA